MSDVPKSSGNVITGFKRLYGHLSARRRRQLFLVMALMLVGAIAELATLGAVLPFLALIAEPGRAAAYPVLQSLFGALGWSNPDNILIPATLLFAAIALGAGAIRVLLAWVSQKFVFRLGYDFSVEVYRRTLFQPYSYHVSKNTSELIAGINKVQMVIFNMLLPLMLGVIAVVISAFILAALIAIDAKIALLAVAGFGLMYLGVTYATRGRLKANSATIANAQTQRVQTVQEGLGGIRDVLIDQAQAVYLDKFKHIDSALRDAQAMNVFIGAAPRFVIEACGMVLIAVLALVLSSGSGGLVAALPVLGALALGAQRLLPLLQLIYNGWTQIAGTRQVLFDILGILDLPIHPRYAGSDDTTLLRFERDISLNDIGFKYDGDSAPVLNNVSLTIKKGARIGFIGKTGSGKSTIVDLVMGLLEPTSGEIRIDGEPLNAENVRGWQAQVAHVPQAIYLADTSIEQNIALGVLPEEIDRHRVYDAARRAEMSEFIESLPDGYKTMVGERGIRLSGGQRQRIGIARALYKQASVLVFDEATSALDNETEAAVMAAIRSLGRDLTIVIIAHRLSTVEMCDQTFRLESGRIVSSDGLIHPADPPGSSQISPSPSSSGSKKHAL
jgi:ABC-type multidrug transport system fused ATPase/permease subunit